MSFDAQAIQLFEHVRKLEREAATAQAVLATAELKLLRQSEAVEQAMQQYKRLGEEAVIFREAADAAKSERDISRSRLLESIGSALDDFNLLQAEIKVRL